MGMDELLEEYRKKRKKIMEMGGKEAIKKQHESGKMTARERIDYFFEPDTFTEIGPWVKHRQEAFGMDKREIPAEGVVTGWGKVNGRKIAVAAEDYTSLAGTFGEYHGKKFANMIDSARDAGIPFVGMNDSAGARLHEGMDTLQAYAWLFRSQILASGVIPQIALLMGPCLGGQAYHPIMQDFLIQTEGTGFMGIAGPAFVKAQTGEEISLEELCGTEPHAMKAGQTDIIGGDDEDSLDKAKELLTFLPQNSNEKPARVETDDEEERTLDEADATVPADPRKPYDMHELIKQISDEGYFFEIKEKFAPNVITGLTRIGGRSIGVVASNPIHKAGVIDVDAADKYSRFVRFCDLFNIPLLNIHDTPGFMIGSDQEWKGILRHGAKTLYSYIEATVPKVSVIVRKSFAGAYLGMCCKDTGADFVFAWPSARITIVGPDTAASVIFAKEIKSSDEPEKVREKRIKEYDEKYVNPYRGAERGWIDDIIEPSETRKYVSRTFEALEGKTDEAISVGHLKPKKKYSNINL